MVISGKEKILNLEGVPFKDNGTDLTIKDIIMLVLNTPESKDKLRAYKICLSLSSSDSVELNSEDIVLIKSSAEEMLSPIVFGRLLEALGEIKKD